MGSGVQATGLQYSGFQLPFENGVIPPTPTPASNVPNAGHFVSPYSRQKEEEKRRELQRQKTELEKLDSVLAENERKAALAAESQLKAKKKADRERLLRLQNEYLAEVARLLMVREELTRRVRQSEEALILMIAMQRRRLRTVQLQVPLAQN